MFKTRSTRPERIDTGDYTPAEYERFLEDIRLVNRFAGDTRSLQKTLLKELPNGGRERFSVLDVGAGSGELLRAIADFARRRGLRAELCGLELNRRSAEAILEESAGYREIRAVRGDALALPFADGSFDHVICSLFTHHLSDEQVVRALREMGRVAARRIYVIDLHRHPAAYAAYKAFCVAFRISPLVRHDGSLSILKGFKTDELSALAEQAGLSDVSVGRYFPFRLVLSGRGNSE